MAVRCSFFALLIVETWPVGCNASASAVMPWRTRMYIFFVICEMLSMPFLVLLAAALALSMVLAVRWRLLLALPSTLMRLPFVQ